MIPHLEQLEDRSAPAAFLTPAEVSAAYQFDGIPFALNGAGQTIAIVEAYGDPQWQSDLDTFDAQFGLAPPPLLASWTLPSIAQNDGLVSAAAQPNLSVSAHSSLSQQQLWGAETALDVEWAHAMAPGANIVVIQSPDAFMTDMLNAVEIAAALPAVSVVSMSWGSPELPIVSQLDSAFDDPGHPVAFVAASGDSVFPMWPATNPNVLAVGGTVLDAGGAETPWPQSGQGFSWTESEPPYQRAVQQTGQREVPDVSYNAGTPYSIYAGALGGWLGVEGTSAGAPQWAALVSIMDEARQALGKAPLDGGSELLPLLYLLDAPFFHDTGVGRGSPNAAALTLAGLLP